FNSPYNFSFIPFLGLILSFFFNEYNPLIQNWCLSTYRAKRTPGDPLKLIESEVVTYHTNNSGYLSSLIKETLEIIEIVNSVFSGLSIIIVIFVLLYIFLKFIKYTYLKDGKGETGIKEYYHFCKELITVK
ncbi:hypothetical protein PCYB_006600, partial [Plasmodium cynomolgi strain B]